MDIPEHNWLARLFMLTLWSPVISVLILLMMTNAMLMYVLSVIIAIGLFVQVFLAWISTGCKGGYDSLWKEYERGLRYKRL